ncbi:MAG TPA: class I SAM-dependent methyltransferase [Candidatus Dormibacteraeota bacterium]|nr:class I SAM-dependent methyltransferase [Candidatus Dormibacteraeota bacterium]
MHDPKGDERPGHLDDPGRSGARQPERFDPRRADKLDEVSRFDYLPPEKVLRLLDPPSGGLIVDYGAGTGTYAICLARSRPDAAVIALDEQPEMLERLRAKPEAQNLRNLRPVLPGEMEEFRGRADRVLALNVLHELGDESLAELKSLLKDGGFALCIDWNAEADRPVGPPKDHVYTPAEATRRLEGLGFSVERLDSLPYHYALRVRPECPIPDPDT